MNYKIVAKYIKDLKFEIPNPKLFFLLAKEIGNYRINIDIKSNQFKEKIIEVETTLSLKPIKESVEKINTRITYSAIVEIQDKISSKEDLEKIILINVPSDIYSDLRNVFIFMFNSSGFKQIKIDEKINFSELYKLRKGQ
tara:strand:+ start:3801 stop:4220 length:420 start_codon:yes stop_codon:yes gene_type:complete